MAGRMTIAGFSAPPTYYVAVKELFDLATYSTAIQPLYEKAADAKFAFGNFLAVRNHRLAKEIKEPNLGDRDLKQLYYQDTTSRLGAMQTVIEADLTLVNQLLFSLESERAAGRLKISSTQHGVENRRLEGHFFGLQAKLIVLREQESTLAGELSDIVFWGKAACVDWPLVNSIIRRLTDPESATHPLFKEASVHERSRFHRTVLEAYGTVFNQPFPHTFCCIEGSITCCEAAAIVPQGLGEAHARYLFGDTGHETEGHLMSAANGLSIKYNNLTAWERSSIGLAPIPGKPDEYQIVWSDLEESLIGNNLSFQNEFRPGRRYLIFAYVLGLLRHQRRNPPGWWRSQKDHGLGEIWATPGRANFIRKSALLAMATRIGLMERHEALEFLGIEKEAAGRLRVGPRDILVSDIVHLSPHALSLRYRPETAKSFCWTCLKGD